LEFIDGDGVSLEGGLLRVGFPTTIKGDFVNSGGSITGIATSAGASKKKQQSDPMQDSVFTLFVEGSFTLSESGALYIRRTGFGTDYKNTSLLVVESCNLGGAIYIKNDEGITPGDRFPIMRLNPPRPLDPFSCVINTDLVVEGNYAEDPSLSLEIKDNEIFVVAANDGDGDTVSSSSTFLPSRCWLLFLILALLRI